MDETEVRLQVLEDYRKKVREHREIEAKLKNSRQGNKDLVKEFEETEYALKALQSVGQIIGDTLRQLDEEAALYDGSMPPTQPRIDGDDVSTAGRHWQAHGSAWPDKLCEKRLCRASVASRNSSRPSSRGTSRVASRVASVADLTAVPDVNTAAANTGGDSASRASKSS